jgi:hypothetical protein
MKTRLLAVVSLALFACSLQASAQERIARFEGGIGSQPLRAGGLPNDVFGVPPGGRPWEISRLSVDVRSDGGISVDARGLILGGGNNIGRPGNQVVHARLFCDGMPHNSPAVQVEPDGDFRIEGQLTPLPPQPCGNSVLLIVNAGGSWFAAGIPRP